MASKWYEWTIYYEEKSFRAMDIVIKCGGDQKTMMS